MKTVLYFSTLLALALADKPSPTYSGASSAAATTDPYATGAQAAQAAAEAAEPVAPSTQGFYYYYYPVASSYEDNSIQKKPQQQQQQHGYGHQSSGYAPDRQETVGGTGLTAPFLGVIGVLAVAAVGAALFMNNSNRRRAFSDAFSAIDVDDVAYYVFQGIQFWTDVQKQ